MIGFNTSLTITDPALITAVQYLQTGNYFIVSWHDFKVVALIIGASCMIYGYALANSDKILEKIKGASIEQQR